MVAYITKKKEMFMLEVKKIISEPTLLTLFISVQKKVFTAQRKKHIM